MSMHFTSNRVYRYVDALSVGGMMPPRKPSFPKISSMDAIQSPKSDIAASPKSVIAASPESDIVAHNGIVSCIELYRSSKSVLSILQVEPRTLIGNWTVPDRTKYVVLKEITDQSKAKKEYEAARYNLQHPNLRKIYYISSSGAVQQSNPSNNNNHCSLYMEWLDFGSADALIKALNKARASSFERAIAMRAVVIQVMHALRYLHVVAGLYHRDIKPANVLIHSDGRVKVCDFDSSKSTTEPGVTLDGTFKYQAPELKEMTVSSCSDKIDMWALGVMMDEFFPKQESSCDETSGEFSVFHFPYSTLAAFGKALLNANPSQRISSEKALEHPFLALSWQDVIEELSKVFPLDSVELLAALRELAGSGRADSKTILSDNALYTAWSKNAYEQLSKAQATTRHILKLLLSRVKKE